MKNKFEWKDDDSMTDFNLKIFYLSTYSIKRGCDLISK